MFELGPIAAALLIAIPASQVIGALLARPHYRRVLELAEEVEANGNASDKVALKGLLSTIVDRRPIWIVAPLAPLLFFVALWTAVSVIFEKSSSDEAIQAEVAEHQEFHRKLAMEADEVDPAGGTFWKSSEWSEINDRGLTAYFLRAPLLTAWIVIWIAPALLIALITGGARRAIMLGERLLDDARAKIGTALHAA